MHFLTTGGSKYSSVASLSMLLVDSILVSGIFSVLSLQSGPIYERQGDTLKEHFWQVGSFFHFHSRRDLHLQLLRP